MSPPDQLHAPTCAHLDSLVGLLRCRAVPVVVCTDGDCQRGSVPAGPAPLDPLLERYVTRLLAMSQANVELLNVSSSDVSLTSDVVSHPQNTACRVGGDRTERPVGVPAPAPTPATSPEGGGGGSPGQRSVGIEVSPEDLLQHCAECGICRYNSSEPGVAPRPRTPSPARGTTDRSCSPVCQLHLERSATHQSRRPAHIPTCALAASKPPTQNRSCSPVCPPCCAVHAARSPQRRSCSPVCPPACAAPEPKPPAANSPNAPLDTTEYLQHELFTRGAFRRVPPTVGPADPAQLPFSPDYRTLAAPKAAPPLRVGGGDRPADSSHSTPSDASSSSSSWCACDSARTPPPPPPPPPPCVADAAWRCAAADVAEMSQRCARRIESLARLIEHVRSEKNNLPCLQPTSRDASPVCARSPPQRAQVTPPAPTHGPVPTRTPTRHPARSPSPPCSPGQNQRVVWSPDPPPVGTETTTDCADRNETWFQRLQRQNSPPSCGRQPPPMQHSSTGPCPPSCGKQPPPMQHSPTRPCTAPESSTRCPASPTRPPQRTRVKPASRPKPIPHSCISPRKRSPVRPAKSPPCSPVQPTSPRRPESPPCSPVQPTSPRRPASSPPLSSPPSGVCKHVCPGTVVVSPRDVCSPPHHPMESCPTAPAPEVKKTPVELLDSGGGVCDDSLWVFAPGSWPPCPGAWGRVLRPKPPPAMWRPGVPYVEQHELSAIPEADMSQSQVEADASQRRSPPPTAPPHTPLMFGTVTGEATNFHTGPRENLHGLLIATHLAAEQVDPWMPPNEPLPPCAASPVSLSFPSCPHAPRSPPPQSPNTRNLPPASHSRSPTDFLPCSHPSPPPCAALTQTTPTSPRSRSPGPCSSQAHSPSFPPPCSPPCSTQAAAPMQREDEDDPDIVAELIRRGVLRSPFSWMKSADSGPRVDVDVDVSVMSGASSDFVSDLLISGSSSTPRKARHSSPDSPEQLYRRQRGGADEAFAPIQDASSKQHLAENVHHSAEDSGTLEALPEDLEGMFERLGLGWAASMLRKTQEAMAISSSSSEASRGASRPSGGGGSGGAGDGGGNAPGGGTNTSVMAGTNSVPRRGHSTPADASAASDGSGSASWTRGQVIFTGDSDMSSVTGVSSRDLSTPSVSLVVKSKSKNDHMT